MAKSYTFTSHESFAHDSIESLGYDWERIANPNLAPKLPFKLYLPTTTDEIVLAVRECRQLGQELKIRSKGHSSNDLVLADRGCVLCTEKLDKILKSDFAAGTVLVQSGVVLAELDEQLSKSGWGLPIIGDHNHITAGGFASVGGISPASHRYGMFLDNVLAAEVVTADGTLVSCSKEQNNGLLYSVLAGLGRHGILATLTLRIIQIDKLNALLRNDRELYASVDQFVDGAHARICDPKDCIMERGVWLDYLIGGLSVRLGQFSSYYETSNSPLKMLQDRLQYGYLHGLGEVAGRVPRAIDLAVKALGMVGVMLSPRYATVKNVETFTDRVLDSSVGDPTRMFIALAPVDRFPSIFKRLHDLFLEYRTRHACFTFISIYVKAIRSEYLAVGASDGRYSELMFYCGVNPTAMTGVVLEDLVSKMDDICIEEKALRYMHTRTVKDAARLRLIDPHALRNPADH